MTVNEGGRAIVGTVAPQPGPASLAQLPAGNAGVPISSSLFAPELLAIQALLLHAVLRVPPDMLWQTIIGLNILASYGLYAPTIHLAPTDTFSFDETTRASQVSNPNLNPRLADEPIDLYADARDPTWTHRPFLVCNSAMFLKEPTTSLELLAPVQITPFITGIFGTPTGEDANGRKPGGGINSFGFNSAYLNASSHIATAAQTRQWSLTDAICLCRHHYGTLSPSIPACIGNLSTVMSVWSG